VAVDTPAGIAALSGAGQRMRFRPSTPVADDDLLALPEVGSVERHGQYIVASGSGDLVQAVTSLLARRQIIAADLRIEQNTLDDAFVTLTTHTTQD
jgi:ABC-2 type transport system ATP-binding protein